MKVESSRSVGTSGVRKEGKSTGSTGFADNLRVDEKPPTAPVSATPMLSGIEGLFALQEVGDALTGRKKALLRGSQMLDRLDDLKRGLLLGHISKDKLQDLARLAAESAAEATDPDMREVLGEIELRAHVELAKLEPGDA
jgi:hypothetical protein